MKACILIFMPQFTAFIHSLGAPGLEETLSSIRMAPDILVIHNGDPAVERLCLRHGARGKTQIPGVTPGAYVIDAFYDWLLLLEPGEELNDVMLNTLSEWRKKRKDDRAGYLIDCGAESGPQLRLVNRTMMNWIGDRPPIPTSSGMLPGSILRSGSRLAA